MIFKYAIRNLIRSPWRTFLYIAVTVLITLSVTASLFVYRTAEEAQAELEENYIFIASLVPKTAKVVLPDLGYCMKNNNVLALNVSMTEAKGVILGGDYLFQMPKAVPLEEANMIFWDDAACNFVATENMGLTYPFFTGECTIKEGTGITQEGYMGRKDEAVIPWWFAEEYGIKIGDLITRRYDYDESQNWCHYMQTEVVGIYETNAMSPDPMDYPVYIPLSIAEFDYQVSFHGWTDRKFIEVRRADFVLEGRDSFEAFVRTAKENGLNLNTKNIVFNNRSYDILSSELHDIHDIALIVAISVFAVGMGMMIFFTAYLCTSRKNERILLTSLGMKKQRVWTIFALEIVGMLMLAVGIGLQTGHMAAEGVCSYVETTVSEKAAISDTIEKSGKGDVLNDTDPLEKTIKLHLSVSDVYLEGSGADIQYMPKLKEGEVGTAKHIYYLTDKIEIGGNISDKRVPVTVIGLSDFETLGIHVTDTSDKQPTDDQRTYGVCAYVSHEFYEKFVMEEVNNTEKRKYDLFYVAAWGMNELIQIDIFNSESIGKNPFLFGNPMIVLGVYDANPYFSGNDILVSMEDYHKCYECFSVTNDRREDMIDTNFYFERMEIFDIRS